MATPEPSSPAPPTDAGDLLTRTNRTACPASQVIQDEIEAILRRRTVAFPQAVDTPVVGVPVPPNGAAVPRPEVSGDLVGLALSGGGIRSAMFNLGLLQALHHNGLLRYVDYLSTVSGGSYLGAHFSSLMLKLQHNTAPATAGAAIPPDQQRPEAGLAVGNGAVPAPEPVPADRLQILKDQFPLKEERFRPQNNRVLQFIRTGSYLDRPWDFVIHYVSGLFLNLLFFTSALVFLCALLAFVWRVFDLPWLRDLLFFGQEEGAWTETVRALTPDLVRAFVPALLCWGAFGVVKLAARLLRSSAAWQPFLGRLKTIVYVCAWLSVLVAVTVLLGNGDTSLGIFRHLFPESWLTYNPATGRQDSINLEVLPASLRVLIYGLVSGLNILVVAKSLLPLLIAPLGTAQKKRRPGWLDNILIRAGLATILCGIPLLLLYFMARENVSGQAPLGKALQVNYAGPAEGRPRLLAVRLTPYEGQNPSDQELARIRLIFDRDLDSAWADNLKYSVNTPWDGGAPQGEVQSVELLLDGWDKKHTLTLIRRDRARLPADRYWLEIVGDDKFTPPVTGIGIAGWLDIERLARKTEDPSEPTLIDLDQAFRWKLLVVGGIVFLVTGIVVNFNWTSLHGFYRDRLAEAYIEEAIPGRGRKIPLSGLCNVAIGAPYHLISGTHVLVGNRREPERTCHFLFSAKYCGSAVTGFWPTRQFLGRHFDDLAEVTALSGASLTPAQVRSLPLFVLMTTVNVRLGQWLPHPARRRWLPWPSPLGLMLGFLHDAEDRRRCFVSDGGHDENLGLWPLVQRRCKLIIVSDASQDVEHSFDDFLKFCRRARLQSGIEFIDLDSDGRIDFKTIELRPDFTTEYHYFVARIVYPAGFPSPGQPGGEGFLIYIKPSLTLDENPDLLKHFKHRRPFPHDPTLDQLFDEDTVESYRQLGSHIGGKLGQGLPAPGNLWQPATRHAIADVKSWLLSGLRGQAVPLAGAAPAAGQPAADLDRDWQTVHEILQKHEASPERISWLYEQVEAAVRQVHLRLNMPAPPEGRGQLDATAPLPETTASEQKPAGPTPTGAETAFNTSDRPEHGLN